MAKILEIEVEDVIIGLRKLQSLELPDSNVREIENFITFLEGLPERHYETIQK
jgi:hypothetical protein